MISLMKIWLSVILITVTLTILDEQSRKGKHHALFPVVGAQGQSCSSDVFEAAFACQNAQNEESRSNVDACCGAVFVAEASTCFCDKSVVATLGEPVIEQLAITFNTLGCGVITSGDNCNGRGQGTVSFRFPPSPPPPPPPLPRTSSPTSSSLPADVYLIQNGLEAYWFLNEKRGSTIAYDATNNGNNGTFHGKIAYRQPGASKSRTVASSSTGFNGVDAYISIPYNSELNSQSFSVSLWTRPKTPPTTGPEDGVTISPFQAVIESTDIFNGRGFMLTRLGASNGGPSSYWTIVLGGQTNTGSVALSSDIEVRDGAWYHIVATYSNLSRKLTIFVVKQAQFFCH